jgi:hypothetical protein
MTWRPSAHHSQHRRGGLAAGLRVQPRHRPPAYASTNLFALLHRGKSPPEPVSERPFAQSRPRRRFTASERP